MIELNRRADEVDLLVCPGRKILVVDDEEAIVRLLMRSLTSVGYQVASATGGLEALRLLNVEPFDALITDIHMPDLRGGELQRLGRDNAPNLAVVFITVLQDIAVAVECLKDGVHDYVTKPFDLADVSVRVGKALEKRDLIIRSRGHNEDIERRVVEQAVRIQEMFQQSAEALCTALDAKDVNTHDHSRRTSAIAADIARRLRPDDPEFAPRVRVAAVLHDLGKIGVPNAILNKPGKLEEWEFARIRTHPETSESIVRSMFSDTELLLSIRHHHEHWDGGGYPDGLVGEAIPLGARIIGVADAFDAMISPRPYRPTPMTPAVALAILDQVAGSQVDATVVEALVAMNAEGLLESLTGFTTAISAPNSKRKGCARIGKQTECHYLSL